MVKITEEIDHFHQQEEEELEEVIDYDDLKKRMWKDRILLQKLKEKGIKDDQQNQQAKDEASRRKKMSRAQDSILKYMMKIMTTCKAQGFVYGIIPEKGKPVTEEGESSSTTKHVLNQLEECGSSEKRRKFDFDFDVDVDIDKLLSWQYAECPQSELGMGFSDKSSRVNHESLCSYRTEQGNVPFHDWLNMGIAGASNQNQDHNNLVENVNELREIVDRTVEEDYGGFWLNSVQDLELHAGVDMERDNVDLNQNPAQVTTLSHEETSIWDLTYN
ncbi:hypothetical protein TSUD_78900 [Trifolium subterraneum]|uniref:Ethylene insensitive 3-like DNA-binding domain-containing protein n=1 Tax=Trifolium subterraneum TaxID=3900 RepID=A0A2Z6LP89_TRISU|nr:hypothetical protein TSUD_78900 [Trifolium subterraneum]